MGVVDDDDMEEVMAPFAATYVCVDETLFVDCSLLVEVDVEDVKAIVVGTSVVLVEDVRMIWDAIVVDATDVLVGDPVVVGAEVVVASVEVVGVSTVLVVDSEVVGVVISAVDMGVVTAAVSAGCVATADDRCVVEVLVKVMVDVEVEDRTAVASKFTAAVIASSISSSDIGFSRSSQPACAGAKRSEPTLMIPSGQPDSIHSSTVSRRPFLAATHMSFWSSSVSNVYPTERIQSKTQSENSKVTLSSAWAPSTWLGRSVAAMRTAFCSVFGSILLNLSFQTSD